MISHPWSLFSQTSIPSKVTAGLSIKVSSGISSGTLALLSGISAGKNKNLKVTYCMKGILNMLSCQKLTTSFIESFVEWFQRFLINNGRLCVFPPQAGPRMIQSGNLFIQERSLGLKLASYTWPHTERKKSASQPRAVGYLRHVQCFHYWGKSIKISHGVFQL